MLFLQASAPNSIEKDVRTSHIFTFNVVDKPQHLADPGPRSPLPPALPRIPDLMHPPQLPAPHFCIPLHSMNAALDSWLEKYLVGVEVARKYPLNGGDHITIVNLARRCQLPELLLSAFYLAASTMPVGQILNGYAQISDSIQGDGTTDLRRRRDDVKTPLDSH